MGLGCYKNRELAAYFITSRTPKLGFLHFVVFPGDHVGPIRPLSFTLLLLAKVIGVSVSLLAKMLASRLPFAPSGQSQVMQ